MLQPGLVCLQLGTQKRQFENVAWSSSTSRGVHLVQNLGLPQELQSTLSVPLGLLSRPLCWGLAWPGPGLGGPSPTWREFRLDPTCAQDSGFTVGSVHRTMNSSLSLLLFREPGCV